MPQEHRKDENSRDRRQGGIIAELMSLTPNQKGALALSVIAYAALAAAIIAGGIGALNLSADRLDDLQHARGLAKGAFITAGISGAVSVASFVARSFLRKPNPPGA